MITDFHNKYKNNEKYVRMTKMWHRDIKWTNAFWKMSPDTFTWCGVCGVVANLQLGKKKKSSVCEVLQSKVQ